MPRFRARRAVWLTGCLLLAALLLAPPGRAQEIRYLYDELNRLVGVVDQEGNAAEYIYDNLGNLLQIKRFNVDPSAAVSITLVYPNRGGVGTVVRLFGTGFSATAAQNTVTFSGGATATVTEASSTSLTTSVPAGATTGPLTVTTPLGTATAPEPFTVPLALAVVPPDLDLVLGSSFDFRAEVGGSPAPPVTWRVNGIAGGNAALGTISPEGLYTAPRSLPPVQPVTVEAVLTADPAQTARATVRLVPVAAGLVSSAPLAVGVASLSSGQTTAAPVTVAAPAAASGQVTAGPLSVGVAAAQGAQALSGPLTVTAGPVLTGVAPSVGAVGTTGLAVTVAGRNLQGASGVRFLRDGLSDSTLTASGVVAAGDGTSVSFSLTISATAPPGSRLVQVVTPQGTSSNFDLGTNGFTVTP
jgi:YD repeat-containing protein